MKTIVIVNRIVILCTVIRDRPYFHYRPSLVLGQRIRMQSEWRNYGANVADESKAVCTV